MELGGTLSADLSDTVLDSSSFGFGRLCDEIDGRIPGRTWPRQASIVSRDTAPS